MRVSSYLIGVELPETDFYLLLHGYSGAVDKVAAPLGRALVQARGSHVRALLDKVPGADLRALAERGYVTELDEEAERQLLVSIAVELHTSDLTTAAAGFMFVPAYTCNLRCPYCFQPHEYHRGAGKYGTLLSRDLVDAAFSIAERVGAPGDLARELGLLPALASGAAKGTSGRKVGLFGGEPLSEATRGIVEYIVAEAISRNMTVTAITNGVELDRFVDLLGPRALSELQITLDGTARTHDRRRVGPGFKETFGRICDNVDLALSHGVRISLRMNVDSVNAAQLESLSDFVSARGWGQTPLFRAHAASVSASGNYTKISKRAELVEQTMDLRHRKGSPFFSYEKAARETLESCLFGEGYPFKGVANCSAESGLLMFDPLGDVYACWEEIGDPECRVATYDADGIRFEGDRMVRWMSRFPGAIDECSRCPYALIHVSGCGKHAADRSGTMYAAACEDFKSYFPRTLARAYDELEAEVQERPVRFRPGADSGSLSRQVQSATVT
jgi:uncharacterized protein